MLNVENTMKQIAQCKMESAYNCCIDDHEKSENFDFVVSKIDEPVISESYINYLANFGERLVKTSKLFLETYKEKALSINPIGLTTDIVSESTKIDIDSALSYYYEKCKNITGEACGSKDEACGSKREACKKEACKKHISELGCIGKNNESYDKDTRTILAKCSIFEKCCKKETCTVDKRTVKEAVDYLENIETSISDMIDKAISIRSDIASRCITINNKIETSDFIDDDIVDVLCTEAEKITVLHNGLVASNYLAIEAGVLKEKVMNACKILAETANYNPREMKNSMEKVSIVESFVDDYFCVELADVDSAEHQVQDIVEIEEAEKLDKLKVMMTKNNKKFLEKYEEQALKSSCLGITIDKWYVPLDADKAYKELLAETEKTFKVKYKDIDELKAAYKKLRGSFAQSVIFGVAANSAENQIALKQMGDKYTNTIKKVAYRVEKNHKVTKSDVKDAVAFLKKDLASEISKLEKSTSSTSIGLSYNIKSNTIGKSAEDKLKIKISDMEEDTKSFLKLNYEKIKIAQLKTLQKQSRLVILKAARQKVSESEVNESIKADSILEEMGSVLETLNGSLYGNINKDYIDI